MRYLIIFSSFLFFYSNAQPLPSIIIVDSISFSKKPLFVKKIKANNTKTTIYFLSLSMKKTMPIAISNNGKNIFIYKKADKLYSNLGYTVEFTKNRKINRYEKSSDESNIKIEKTPEKDIFIKQDKIFFQLVRTNYDNTKFDKMVITNNKEEKMIVNFIFYPFERKKYDINITIPFKKGIYEIKNPDNPQIIEKIDDN